MLKRKKEFEKTIETLQLLRQNIRIHCYLCSSFQILLAVLVLYELATNNTYYCTFWATVQGTEMFVGFVCITMLHL